MDPMTAFKTIRARAEKRKGGPEKLNALLPPIPKREALSALADDRALAEMTKRVFCAGFAWSVIEAKWPGFEAAFFGFDPARLLFEPDEFWEKLGADARIVRYPAKILSVRKNARFVQAIAKEHGSFGEFLAGWPAEDEIGLLALLAKRGDRLGGNSGQMLLRYIGWDAFVITKDVVACLRDAGLDIAPAPISKGDLSAIQQQFNVWAKETGLPYAHLSRICAFSMGEQVAEETLRDWAAEVGGQ
jgi:3-methyladenine DNA glycosylase Tag